MISSNLQDQIHIYYTTVRQIAQGSFGKVYQCIQPQSENKFAVKVIDKSSVKKNKIELLRSQSKIFQSVNHPNIVKLKGIRQTQRHIYLEMEYIQYGTLGKFIQERRDQQQDLSVNQIAAGMKAIFSGLSHLHSLNIIHRDLKPCIFFIQNILAEDQRDLSALKIADFGLSIKVDLYATKPNQHCGTLLYMAPQVLKKRPYTKSVDIWSSAIIMYMLFNKGKHPLVSKKTKMSVEQYLIEIMKPWPKLSNELAQDFIQKISKIDPIQRYTAGEALKHPFLTRNKNDPIPLTYNESFKSFEINQRYSQKIRLMVIISKYFEIGQKLIISKSYLEKVDQFNQQSEISRNKSNQNKKNSPQKFLSSHNIREIFSGFQSKNKHQSIESDSPKKSEHYLKNSRATHMINFSFMSHFDQCIKIRDLKPDQEKNLIKISEVTNHRDSQTKLQQLLGRSSFSPTKISQKKKFVINFPKISQSKEKTQNSQNINSIMPGQNKSRMMSPKKRIVSCNKYIRPIIQQTNQSKMK